MQGLDGQQNEREPEGDEGKAFRHGEAVFFFFVFRRACARVDVTDR